MAHFWGFPWLFLGLNDLHATIAVTKSAPDGTSGRLGSVKLHLLPSPIRSIHAA